MKMLVGVDLSETTEKILKKSELRAGGDLLLRADNDINFAICEIFQRGILLFAGSEA